VSTGPRRIGKYELQERLGLGGMAEVWKAFDPQLHRFVAIKFIRADLRNDSDFMKRFEREARAIASLHHPNIIQIHDFQVTRSPESEYSLAYMVMACIEGPTLAGYISDTSQVGKFPSATDLVHLFTPISAAIDYAHQKGMIHRDIKPANILLDEHNTENNPMGEPILTDFGIVKMLRSFTSSLIGTWIGTPLYMSPEQARGQPGNERSDIYSLGVILYEICTGVRPFQGDNQISIIMQHVNAAPPQPELINQAIPPALSEVILRSLSKDPEERFPSASSMVKAIIQALDLTPSMGLNTPVFSTDYSHPSWSPQPSIGLTPSSPPLLDIPVDGAFSPISPEARVTPRFSTPVSGLNTPVTPHGSPYGPPIPTNSLKARRAEHKCSLRRWLLLSKQSQSGVQVSCLLF
jgi:serine/threonine protein kinase